MYGHEDELNGRKGAKGANHMVKGGTRGCSTVHGFSSLEPFSAKEDDGNKRSCLSFF
jgi:hypothetical protein